MSARSQQPRGYVLVLTLAVLVLAASALMSAGRLAVDHASRARQAERDLQRRAGVASCRAAILPQVEQLLQAQEVRRKAPVPQHRASVQLGDFAFDLLLCDEQAKASINALLEASAPDVVENRLQQALAGTGMLRAVRLRPVASDRRLVVSGPGQVFDATDPAALLHARGAVPAPLELVTCWGNGAINARRAMEPSLRLALGSRWTPLDVSRLLDSRKSMFADDTVRAVPAPRSGISAPVPRDPLARLLQTAQIRTGPAGLTLRSTCHSLWIVSRDAKSGSGTAPLREWYDLAVEDASDERAPHIHTFSW